jgi:hypothetical protein
MHTKCSKNVAVAFKSRQYLVLRSVLHNDRGLYICDVALAHAPRRTTTLSLVRLADGVGCQASHTATFTQPSSQRSAVAGELL